MKMHVLSGGRVRMRKSVYIPDAAHARPSSCRSLASCCATPGQRAVRHRLPPAVPRTRGALGRPAKIMAPIMRPGDNVLTGLGGIGLAPTTSTSWCARICIPIIAAATRSSSARPSSCTRRRSRPRARRTPRRWAISRPNGISAPFGRVDGQRDLFGDGRIVLIPLPGHTPGSIGALVELERAARSCSPPTPSACARRSTAISCRATPGTPTRW